jgi:hypothetical protein
MDNDRAQIIAMTLTILENRVGEPIPTDCFLYRMVEVFAETVVGIANYYNQVKERR